VEKAASYVYFVGMVKATGGTNEDIQGRQGLPRSALQVKGTSDMEEQILAVAFNSTCLRRCIYQFNNNQSIHVSI
jgi:hypothetical protein